MSEGRDRLHIDMVLCLFDNTGMQLQRVAVAEFRTAVKVNR
jgi:hypothetical protein